MGITLTNEPHRGCWHWARPALTVYRAGSPKRLQFMINRYTGHRPIGASVQINGRVFSFTWARLGRKRKRHG